jgi:hypothetical protein
MYRNFIPLLLLGIFPVFHSLTKSEASAILFWLGSIVVFFHEVTSAKIFSEIGAGIVF